MTNLEQTAGEKIEALILARQPTNHVENLREINDEIRERLKDYRLEFGTPYIAIKYRERQP